ncbi:MULTISPECIES: DUF4349 domain-containing protein [Dysgonomonas]|uniref:DUF4349 domain-containing protein n=1 Tax=Dysgonomonas gadei ATCC BAA-286 TaxID=742766 RepID=F5IVV4_9BACT|nr:MULTISPECIES: DUF4349 domain-containing protein [Dysgonomonas]EGK02754.1 hypothetical protein HMPREF9455_01004 [Dysgonomonas gadei ATCC BAA-286]MBF0648397.1 DUF4349 domain-containing protein [Dysgonomonas sp. GY75]
MKNITNLFIIAIIGFSGMLSCGNSNKSNLSEQSYEMSMTAVEDEKSSADQALDEAYEVVKKEKAPATTLKFTPPQIVPNFITSSAAVATYDDGVHKFIRTASTKFKVREVVSATQKIEDIALKNRGFIIKSAINNENLYSETVDISKDSSIVNYSCNLIATIELKVPALLLDSVLRQIAPLAVLVDYRTVDAQDVTVKLMSDQLAQIRLAKRQKRISNAISTTGRKLDDVMVAEDALDASLEDADRKVISEYMTNEQVAYSTISISMYQDRIEYSEKILRKTAVKEYTPGFGSKLLDALAGGWSIISAIFLMLVYVWPLIIVSAIGVFIFLKIRKRNKQK